ncbi:MAG TPA: transcriptional regulator, partial [Burkholderiaceae bacterium]
NRIRLNVARDFDWLERGPIRAYFREQGMGEFLDHGFLDAGASFEFTHAMLTEPAIEKMQLELRQVRARLAELHQESLASPLPKRRGCALLMAMREWEPAVFGTLRR